MRNILANDNSKFKKSFKLNVRYSGGKWFDVHAFTKGNEITFGVKIPFQRLLGILMPMPHAITDAIYGAIAAATQLISPNDAENAASGVFYMRCNL